MWPVTWKRKKRQNSNAVYMKYCLLCVLPLNIGKTHFLYCSRVYVLSLLFKFCVSSLYRKPPARQSVVSYNFWFWNFTQFYSLKSFFGLSKLRFFYNSWMWRNSCKLLWQCLLQNMYIGTLFLGTQSAHFFQIAPKNWFCILLVFPDEPRWLPCAVEKNIWLWQECKKCCFRIFAITRMPAYCKFYEIRIVLWHADTTSLKFWCWKYVVDVILSTARSLSYWFILFSSLEKWTDFNH